MKIVLVTPHFYPNIGGIENDIYDTAQGLIRKGHDVTVITSNLVKFKQAKLPDEELIDGIKVRRFNAIFPYPFSKLIFTPSLITSLSSIDVDVFFVMSFLPYFLTNYIGFYASRKQIPLVMLPVYHPERQRIYHGVIPFIVKNLYDKWLGIKLLRRADYVMALIPSEADYYKNLGVKEVSVRWIGIHSEEQECDDKDVKQFRERYQLSGSVLLCLQRLERRKGIQHVIKALPLILEKYPDTQLLIAGGDHGYRSYLEKLCTDMDVTERVIFTDNLTRQEVACAFKCSRLLLLLSDYEVLPKTLIEAWLHRKPVIVSNAAAFRDLVCSETGILVKKENPAEVTEAIMRLLSHPELAESMGQAGYQMVSDRFTWKKVIDATEKVFEKVLEERGR